MNQKQVNSDLDRIAGIDTELKSALQAIGYPKPRIRSQGFETLLSVIVGQQISTAAAAAVMGRVRELLPRMEAGELQKLPTESLRKAGLSGRKVEYAFGLADAIVDGSLDTLALESMDDEDAIRTITTLRGFGDWSAEIYLMFSLRRRDIFPANDLALQISLQRLKGLEQRPGEKQARSLIEHWSPWRSAGSLFLWHYYRGAPT